MSSKPRIKLAFIAAACFVAVGGLFVVGLALGTGKPSAVARVEKTQSVKIAQPPTNISSTHSKIQPKLAPVTLPETKKAEPKLRDDSAPQEVSPHREHTEQENANAAIFPFIKGVKYNDINLRTSAEYSWETRRTYLMKTHGLITDLNGRSPPIHTFFIVDEAKKYYRHPSMPTPVLGLIEADFEDETLVALQTWQVDEKHQQSMKERLLYEFGKPDDSALTEEDKSKKIIHCDSWRFPRVGRLIELQVWKREPKDKTAQTVSRLLIRRLSTKLVPQYFCPVLDKDLKNQVYGKPVFYNCLTGEMTSPG